jgi:hypothetical protein
MQEILIGWLGLLRLLSIIKLESVLTRLIQILQGSAEEIWT